MTASNVVLNCGGPDILVPAKVTVKSPAVMPGSGRLAKKPVNLTSWRHNARITGTAGMAQVTLGSTASPCRADSPAGHGSAQEVTS